MKNSKLSMRENYLRAARRQNPEWVPFDSGLSAGFRKTFYKYAGENADPCEFFNYDGRWIGPNPSKSKAPDWRSLYYSDGSLPADAKISDEWGTAYVYNEDTDDQMDYFPLRNIQTEEEVDAYPWPDTGAAYRYEGVSEKVKSLQKQGFAVHMAGTPSFFESVWNLRGFEQLMVDMALGDPVAKRLFERMHEISVRCAENAARSGADVLQVGSDVATQRGPLMSREMWRTYIFPVMRDSIRAAKAIRPDMLANYHSCGNVSGIIEDLLETGIDILNPCQPEAMDIFELKRRYGKVLSFHGGIGVQSVLPFGTPQEVRDMVRKTIDIMGEGGGYICSSSHNLRPEIPWENFMAVVEVVKEYGHP
ncbi:MAG: uroporphyrinogen decarboxylase family protein [Victivallales bacterium]|jgi:uroporphyrinogen decarboxylase